MKKVAIFLFFFIFFLIWLYFAMYESTINNWWTVKEIKQISSDTVVIGISLVKVLTGLSIFTIIGSVIYLLIRGKRV